jgi:cell wall-associated NlpC family hydrolase
MQPGDLVFFSFNSNDKIDHVGIYIGNGQMIHSPKTGDTVKITNINVTYWQQRYVTSRRIIY